MLCKTHTGSPVGETVVDAVAGKLLRAGSGEDEVSLETGIDNLDDDLLVREADDQAVFGCVTVGKFSKSALSPRFDPYSLLVLRLGNQTLAGVVCSNVNVINEDVANVYAQSVLPSLRRRYLTWKREKYASDLIFFWNGICNGGG